MGIDNRDYLRDQPSYDSGSAPSPMEKGVVIPILVVTIACFFLQLAFKETFTPMFLMDWLSVKSGQVWRVLTYAFCHSTDDIFHIAFNMFIFWMFGRELNRLYGNREFLLFYLIAAIFAALVYVALNMVIDARIAPMLGASGAVMAVEVLYAIHFPKREILIWGIIPMQMRWLIAMLIVFDVYPVIQKLANPASMGDGIAHGAHLGGVLFAFLYWKFGIRFTELDFKNLFGKSWFSRSPKLQIHRPETPQDRNDDLDQRVDEILEKIYQQGEDSLTNDERALMEKASRKYKNR